MTTLSKEQQDFWDLLHLTRTVDEQGTIRFYKNGELHRLNGPAIISANGTKYWFKNGKRHRDDGPAVIRANGSKYWFKNGEKLTLSKEQQEFWNTFKQPALHKRYCGNCIHEASMADFKPPCSPECIKHPYDIWAQQPGTRWVWDPNSELYK